MATAASSADRVDAKAASPRPDAVQARRFYRAPARRPTGLAGKVYDTVNDIIEQNVSLTAELLRISTVGQAGRVRQRASLPGAAGAWAQSIDALNTLVNDMVQPTTEVARVIGAVARGDLSQTMALEIEGRPLTGEFLRRRKSSTRWSTSSARSRRR